MLAAGAMRLIRAWRASQRVLTELPRLPCSARAGRRGARVQCAAATEGTVPGRLLALVATASWRA